MKLNASVLEASATSAMEAVHGPTAISAVPDDSAGAADPAIAAAAAASAPDTAAAATTTTPTPTPAANASDVSVRSSRVAQPPDPGVTHNLLVDGSSLGAVQPATNGINHVLQVL